METLFLLTLLLVPDHSLDFSKSFFGLGSIFIEVESFEGGFCLLASVCPPLVLGVPGDGEFDAGWCVSGFCFPDCLECRSARSISLMIPSALILQ